MKRRRTIDHEFFLQPSRKAHILTSLSLPEKTLTAFCEDKADAFLRFPKLMQKLEVKEHGDKAQHTVNRASLFALELGQGIRKATFWNCPLVWDTGASFCLTPFRGDFIDYVECRIPVKDISKTNMVIGIGTTLHKFTVNGELIWLPCRS